MSNSVIDLLYLAKQSRIDIRLEEGRLQLKAPKNADRDLLDEIKENKELIIDFLNDNNTVNKKYNKVTKSDRSSMHHLPLSFSQERLWFVDQLEGSVGYHIPSVLRLKGNLDKRAMRKALKEIVNRHEVLRTVYKEEEGVPFQIVKGIGGWDLEEAAVEKEQISSYITTLIRLPFDLSVDYMLRATLIEEGEQEHVLVVVMHHIASDGWSMPVIVKEVASLYKSYAENKPSELVPLGLQYADYAIWQRNYLKGEVLENKLSYWKQKLAGVSPLELPLDYPRPLVQGMEGATARFTISKEQSSQLQELSRREGTTLFMTLLAGLNVLLYRYSGQEDINVGTPVANRGQQEIEGLVGFFVNTLALRNEVSGRKSFKELLHQVRGSMLEAYEHQEVPFEKVVDAVVKERDLSRTPLFQVMLVLQNLAAETAKVALGELQLSGEPSPSNASKFEITFTLTETASGLQGSVQYNTSLYKAGTIEQMCVHFASLLASIVKDPTREIGKLKMLSAEEEQYLLADLNDTSVTYPRERSIIDMFEEQAAKTPGATAIEHEEEKLSYQELNERANQLAHYLVSKGIQEETLVPVCIERSTEMIVAVLGILKAGGAYVPIDPEYPAERISYMVEDTGAKLIVSSRETNKETLIKAGIEVIEADAEAVSKQSKENLQKTIKPHNLAYVIYTSGSTGKPKGVMIEHQAMLDHCYGLIKSATLNDCKSFALFAPLVFDAGHAIIFSSLLQGASLNVLSKEQITDGEKLANYLQEHPVDCIKIVPSVWLSYAGEDNRVLAEKVMIFGGEAFSGKIPGYLKKANYQGKVYNHYGPTEATIGKTIHEVNLQKTYTGGVPIGKPFSNTKLYIVDANNQLVPTGASGELYIAGEGLARGYLNQPELTKEKFILDPFGVASSFGNLDSLTTPPFNKAYKTGDKARWNAEGEIEYLGRIDEQVKIRGHRIELGEIENVLAQVAGVKAGAVAVIEDTQGNRQLAGYVVSGGKTGKETIVQQLRGKLPEYMIPQVWTELEEMPLTSNGKVNKKALPKPDTSGLGSRVYTAPTSETETRLAAIWQELLGIERIGIHDNFFELGGHSLLAMRLISAIRRQMKVEVTVKNLFLYPTISLLSTQLGLEEETLLPDIEVSARPAHIPLSFSQERLWFIDQLEGSVQYHLPVVLRLKGKLHREALSHSLQQIVNRHEVLRTVYREQEGQSWQYIKEKDSNKLEIIDGSRYNEDKKGLGEYIQKLTKAPFDLSRDNMLRVTLIALGEEDHVMVATMHHIASDAWSTSILVKEVAELYSSYTEQRMANLPELPLQYADYSIWQRGYLQGELLEKKISYWKEKLEGVSTLQMPTDYKRPAVQSTRGSFAGFKIDKQLSGQLYDLSKKEGTTLFITMQAVYKAMLYRYSGQSDISVGTSIARREQQQLEGLIGFFVNTLALRDEVSGEQSFKELLRQVRTTTMEAYEHQEVPFEKVVETVIKERDKSRSPLFQVMLVLKNTPDVPQLKLGEVTLSGEGHEHTTVKFELTFFINETNNGLNCSVQYCRDLYSAETIARMMAHFTELARSAVKDPEEKIGKLKMLAEEEKQTLAKTYNNKTISYPKEKSVVTLFEEQAAINPGAIAVVFEDEELTYKELNERANQLAHHLRSKGITEETSVPLFIERSAEMIVGMLGIMKAGGAYVPIDTEFPANRISYMLVDTQAKIIVSSKAGKRKLEEIEEIASIEILAIDEAGTEGEDNKENLENKVTASQLAYIIYTSGSTGQPKGAMITHRNLTDYVYGLKEATQIEECKSFALVSTIATDLGNTVLYGSLLTGGALHVFTKEAVSDIYGLHKYFTEHQIDCLKIVPSHWKALSKEEELLLPQKLLVFGGEALHREVLEQIENTGRSCKVVNHYGPTETTIGKLLHVTEAGRKYGNTIPIGKPFSNTRVYVLSKEMEICPTGVPGQLYIAGDGVARGYLNNAALTESKFIKDLFSEEENARMYVTGDLVKYLEDGNIEFIGRADDQVKIRGYRVELGEIESILQQSETVKHAVVLAKEDSQGNKRLIGYVVAEDEFDKAAIESYLAGKLPEYMIPQMWVALESLPLTANGKVDRKSLPEPEQQQQKGHYEAPRNETEEKLAEIWQEILEVEQVSIHDDFFELGGHSLLAIRLISMIRKELGLEVKIGDVFDYPTISLLSGRIATEDPRALLPTIEVSARPIHIPLSFSQERLWFIDQLEGSVQYHLPVVLRLKGKLNREALSHSLQQIVNRHEVLRTVYREQEGQSWQYIKEKDSNKLEIIDGSRYNEDKKGLGEYIQKLTKAPFDLSRDNMLRVTLIALGEEDHVMVATMHHIASDAWSTSILVKEVAELYSSYTEQRMANLPELPLQYADYSIWQRGYLQGELLEKKISYWKEKLEGVSTLQMPTDYKRPAVQSTRGSFAGFKIDKQLSGQLYDLSKKEGTTLFITMQAVYKAMLYRYSGQSDISVGTSIARREQQQLEGLIGFFVNTLALRDEVSGEQSFKELLRQVRTTTMEAYEHQEVPFEKVVETVIKERDKSRSPLFQVMLVLKNTPDVPQLKLGEVTLSGEGHEHTTVKFELTFFINETNNGLNCSVQYCRDLYSAETIARMMAHFTELARSAVKDPEEKIGKLKMLAEEEKQTLAKTYNNKTISYPKEKSVVTLFEEQAAINPGAIAVVFEDEELTYKELNERANQLAHHLRSKGITEETSVPLFIERSAEMIVGMLGIMKAGGAYVPIDTEFPANRISYMLVDTQAKIIVSSKAGKRKLEEIEEIASIEILAIDEAGTEGEDNKENLENKVTASQLAYIIYTSGSTGQPKGAMITHRNLTDYVYGLKEATQIEECKSFALVSTIATDLGNTVLYGSLLTGGALHVFTKEAVSDIYGLHKYFTEHQIDCLKIVPSHWKALSKEEELLLPQKLLVFGGEALHREVLEQIENTGRSCKVVNHYGPTETTIGKLLHVTEAGRKYGNTIPIGKPFSNTRVYVLSKEMEICPTGVPGQLYIAGDGVARGYLNNAALTESKFIKDLFSEEENARMYVTGDLVKYLEDGNIEFIGRADDQVKIRGYRVELGEIESILQQSETVKHAVVLAKEDSQGNKRLIGYVVAEDEFDKAAIESYLAGKLPEYMIPQMWVALESLPLTANGKVDRKSLPEPEQQQQKGHYEAPRNETEEKLAEIWQEILEVEQVSIHDDFFELGGHSLLAVRMIYYIERSLSISIPINIIFEFTTINTLSKYLDLQLEVEPANNDEGSYKMMNI